MQTSSLRTTSPASNCQESSSRSLLIRSWLATYAETYRDRDGLPRDVSDGRLGQIYEKALGDIPTKQLGAALERTLKTCRFFPTPADIRAQLDQVNEQGQELEAEHAWQHALGWIGRYYHPDLGPRRGAPELPPKITHAIRAAGGMHMLFGCAEADLVWRKKDFLADYTRNETLARNDHLLTDGEAKRVLADLRAGPPQPTPKQLAPANEVPAVHVERSFLRMGSEPDLPEERKPVNPVIEITDEVERRIEAQKLRLKEWEATRQKNSAPTNAEQPAAEVLA